MDATVESQPDPGRRGPLVTAVRMGDWRSLLLGGRALVLQVAHPVVGAGVDQFSEFEADLWGRFDRTGTFITQMYYGPAPARTAAMLRGTHRHIRGTDFEGHRYHAFKPEAWLWVHATIVESMVAFARIFDRPLRGRRLDRFYAETCDVARLLGVREKDLPGDWAGFRGWYDGIVEDRLIDNPVVHRVLEAVRHSPPPVRAPGAELVWGPLRVGGSHLFQLATIGSLPPSLRRRFALPWTPAHQVEFDAMATAVRALRPLVPLVPAGVRLLPWYREAARQALSPAGSRDLG